VSPKASTRLLATQSDERLVALVRDGHDRAFEALVQRYRGPLLRYCRRLRLTEGRAEDVVQQAFMQAWSALRRGAEVRELRPWLYRIVHNAYVNLMRDSGRDAVHQAVALDGALGVDATLIDAQASTAAEPGIPGGLALRETLSDMAALPQLQREVIFRTALAGQSHEEVALTLGISDGAVRGLLYRARATLRAAVTALTPPPVLAWMAGVGQGPATERISELAAGGGIGAGGLLVKGGLAALTATLVAGAAIVHEHVHPTTHSHASAKVGEATGKLADVHTSGGGLNVAGASGSALGWSSPHPHGRAVKGRPRAVSGSTHSSVRSRHAHTIHQGTVPAEGSPEQRSGNYTVSVTVPAAGAPSSGQDPGGAQDGQGADGDAGGGSAGSGTGHTGSGSGGSTGNGSGGGSSGGSSGGVGGGSESGAGSAGGESGAGSSGGANGGGGASGGGGGSEGDGGGASGSGGGGSTGSGSGGAGSGESSPPGGAQSSGSPVGTVVHEVTNLLENTVSGLLGH
jgi:RNA polymerase sigma factor (sigma-70 family)